MAEGDPVSGRALSYRQFVDTSEALPRIEHPPIVFNTSSGPVRLLRAAEGELCMESIDDVLTLAKLCAARGWVAPHTLIVNHETYDYLAGLLTGAIMFPRRKDHG